MFFSGLQSEITSTHQFLTQKSENTRKIMQGPFEM